MRKYYWYISIFFRKHGFVIVGSIIAAILIFSLGLPFLSRILDFKKTRYIGVVGKYSLTNLPRPIEDEISLGLTKIKPDDTVVPSIAERWTVEDDGRTYRFLIRKDMVWQDGKPVTSSDITYNFTDVKVVTTDNEVIFKLKDPFVPFPTVVSKPLIRQVSVPYLLFFHRQKLIGIGPNEAVDYTETNQKLTELQITKPEEKKMYRFYPTEEDAVTAFKLGQVDEIDGLSTPSDLSDWDTVQVNRKIDTSSYLAVFFNTRDDIFRSNDIRQALNYALPKPTDDTRAYGPIDSKSWAYADVGKHYDFDMKRAIERLLSPLVLPHSPIRFTLTTTPLFEQEANKIKQAWEDFGLQAAQQCQADTNIKEKDLCENTKVHVDIRISTFPDTNNFQALLIGEESQSDPDQYQLWHSAAQTNFTHYKNIRIDSFLEKGRQTEDQKKRFDIYSQFQQFFSDDAPAIFIRHLFKYDLMRKGR